MTMDDNLQITDDEIPYHKSSVGSKLGAKMGALCGMAHSLMTFAVTKNQSTPMKIGAFMFSTLGMALGGWGIGALADKFANKGSEDFAKKYAEENSQKQIFA